MGWDLQKSLTRWSPVSLPPASRGSSVLTALPTDLLSLETMISIYNMCALTAHCGFDLDFRSD